MSKQEQIPEMFKYSDIPLPPECIHKIGASGISKFFEYPRLYFEENMEGKASSFQGNTATVTGTICHHVMKHVALGTPKEEFSREVINEQLMIYASMRPELNLDTSDIMTNWPLISTVMVNEYLLKATANLIQVEQQILVEVMDGVYVGGTYDRLEGDCIVDFKTTATKPTNTEVIPFNYKIQLLAYAYALRKKGFEINRIRVVYGVKPTKTLGARCFVITEQIDFPAEKLINDTLKLIAESVLICKNRPELIHIIFKSMDLKR